MNSKYPALFALIALVTDIAKQAINGPGSTVQKLEGEIVLIPELLQFIPKAVTLGTELGQIKNSPDDILAAVETLVTDCSFSNEKAKNIIDKSFALAEKIVEIIPVAVDLEKAIKA